MTASGSRAALTRPRSKSQTIRMSSNLASLAPSATPPTTKKAQRVYAGAQERDFDLTTIPDPRCRSTTLSDLDGSSALVRHPDLNEEVVSLSSKLVHAINHQTTLDDNLTETRAELEQARQQLQAMEMQLAKQRDVLVGDIWIQRKSVEAEKSNLLSRIAEEKRLRLQAEEGKKRIEQEVENLTTELFEEANNMVISAKEEARKEYDALQRKNDLLRAQLADTEGLLSFQQAQLTELKHVMEQMSADQDDETVTTTPSSPGFSKCDSREDDTPTSDVGSQSGLPDLITPSHPTSFTHLLQPVLRSDINAYEDFIGLCKSSKKQASRPPSGTQTGLGLGLGLMGPAAASSATSIGISSSASIPSPSPMGSPVGSISSAHQTLATPCSTSVSGVPTPPIASVLSLKDTKFYKRVLVEDVEPTLRLDVAPGLSWLARRSVMSAMSDGSLVVEPVPATSTYAILSKPQLSPCSLCAENRQDEQYLRRYRFRTSESISSQRYPLCRYCLCRVRSACDFLGFLRIIKDGHWRTDDEDAVKAAWEESVRLRENMFWARIGGGVRPILQAFQGQSNGVEKSARTSHEMPIISDERSTMDVVTAAEKARNPDENGVTTKHAKPPIQTAADATSRPHHPLDTPVGNQLRLSTHDRFITGRVEALEGKEAEEPGELGSPPGTGELAPSRITSDP